MDRCRSMLVDADAMIWMQFLASARVIVVAGVRA
jgi:hypothetical protein